MRLRLAAKTIRRSSERLLHSLRRRASIRRLRQLVNRRSSPILVVCHGNICRSPYAAIALKSMVKDMQDPPEVHSAGFIGPGRSSPRIARQVAAERGVDLKGHQSRVIGADMLSEAALIMVMSPAQARLLRQGHGIPGRRLFILGDLDPVSITAREIPDPYDQPREVFSEVFERIDRCLKVAAGLLAGRG